MTHSSNAIAIGEFGGSNAMNECIGRCEAGGSTTRAASAAAAGDKPQVYGSDVNKRSYAYIEIIKLLAKRESGYERSN